MPMAEPDGLNIHFDLVEPRPIYARVRCFSSHHVCTPWLCRQVDPYDLHWISAPTDCAHRCPWLPTNSTAARTPWQFGFSCRAARLFSAASIGSAILRCFVSA